MKACVSSQSPLCQKKCIGPEELKAHPLVLFNFSQRTLHRLVPANEKVKVLMAGNSLSMSRVLLETDPDTIGFSNYLDDLYFKNSSLVSLPLDPPVPLVMGYIETAPGAYLACDSVLLEGIGGRSPLARKGIERKYGLLCKQMLIFFLT